MSIVVALELIINAGTLVACVLLWRELAGRGRRRPTTVASPRAAKPIPSGSG